MGIHLESAPPQALDLDREGRVWIRCQRVLCADVWSLLAGLFGQLWILDEVK
jgi:hypothetical protein